MAASGPRPRSSGEPQAATASREPTPDGLDELLARLAALHPRVIDLSLDRIGTLLAALGHPERQLPPTIHIAGTNGKGSTLAILRAILEEAGHRVHAYTSPHLVRFTERILLAGREIADARLVALLEECERANAGASITYFEITSAAAFLAFARAPADLLLLETGLGGRLDATNVVAGPALTAISRIGLDHHQFLGDTLPEIAFEKAGILKPGVAAVVGPQPRAAAAVVAERARRIGAPLHRHGSEWRVEAEGDAMVYRGGGRRLDLPAPGLAGKHQVENAGLALACLETLDGFAVDEAAIRRGLAGVRWPGRLQRLAKGPLVELLPAGWELWLDGGHNADAGRALAEWAAEWAAEGAARDAAPLHLVAAMLETKDPAAFLAPLAPRAASLHAAPGPGAHAFLRPTDLAAAARALGIAAAPAGSVREAVQAIVAAAERPGRILVCGSLYLIGEVLAENS